MIASIERSDMNRQEFGASAAVQSFVQWAGRLTWEIHEGELLGISAPIPAVGVVPGRGLAALPVKLDIEESRFVPRAIRRYVPFGWLPGLYCWRARGMADGDFAEADLWLSEFSQQLRSAVKAGNWRLARMICGLILNWGGDRDPNQGAWPRLLALKNGLTDYLSKCDELMQLDAAKVDRDGNLCGVDYFGSMWVKIYAMTSATPIYDSRVAGAIATLVETWRRSENLEGCALPPELTFPATTDERRRRVLSRYPDAKDPGVLRHQSSNRVERWAGATIRLGWLIEEILGGNPHPVLVHAFEASLFMAGSDCAGINQQLSDEEKADLELIAFEEAFDEQVADEEGLDA
jgi:hypothetical protein